MARSRRGRGEGGVWQRKDGRWVASVSLGYGADGRRTRRDVYGATKQAALDRASELRGELITGDVRPQRFTVGEYLDEWMKAKTMKGTTRKKYEWVAREAKAHIGHVRLLALKPSQVQALYTILGKGRSARLPSMAHEVLHAALHQAVRWHYLKSNPADGVDRPKRRQRKLEVLTRAQLARFLELARSDRFYALFVLAAKTAMREGEMLALRWVDVDLRRARVSISGTLSEIDGEHEVTDPKTEASRGTVELPKSVVEALREHRKKMLAEGHAGAPVFCDTDGGHVRLSNMQRRHFKPLLDAVEPGLAELIRFHDLRHGLATYLLEENVHPKKVAALLRHASVTTTLKTYSHVLPTQLRDVADITDTLLDGCQSAVKTPEEVEG